MQTKSLAYVVVTLRSRGNDKRIYRYHAANMLPVQLEVGTYPGY